MRRLGRAAAVVCLGLGFAACAEGTIESSVGQSLSDVPEVEVSPLGFPPQEVATTSVPLSVVVKNPNKKKSVSLMQVITAAPFYVEPLAAPLVLQPLGSITLAVTFSPTAVGPVTGTLLCVIDPGADKTVALSGTGVSPPPPPGGDTTPPSVSIVAPASDTTYNSAQTVTVVANATDAGGVARVDFYQDGVLLGSDATEPFERDVSFTAADNGSNVFTARAYDAAGNEATSAPRTLTVAIDVTKPTVAISAPASNTTYTTDQTVTVAATASDNVSVTRVDFYLGTSLVGSDPSSPYQYAWAFTAAQNGAHVFTARAYDAAGNEAISVGRTLTVAIDVTKPTVAISAPASNTTYTTAQTVTVAATASDNVAVTRVDFYLGTSLVGSDPSSPYQYAWAFTAAQNGAHVFTARAYDAAGNESISASRTLTVNIAAPTNTASLTWDPNTEPDLEGYFVYFRAAGQSYGEPIATTTTPSFTVSGLASGTTYYFVVTAFDIYGYESLYSNEASKVF